MSETAYGAGEMDRERYEDIALDTMDDERLDFLSRQLMEEEAT